VEEITAPRLLQVGDETLAFDCGVDVLNTWLKRRALLNHLSGASRTYVAMGGKRIAAYYCLAAGSIQHAATPGKIRRNMPEPIPVLVLGRLAVDLGFQKRGVGPMLLLHALERTQEVAKVTGIRALLVHAKDEEAAEFYKRFGFVESPLDPLMLMVRVSL
jgi:GNAT superfamily N-acetyltransferase